MNIRKYLTIFLIGLFVITVHQLCVAGTGTPQTPPNKTQKIDRDTHFDANQINMFVTNHGSFAYDIPNSKSGLEYPKGSGKYALYAGGLWVGGKIDGGLRVAVAEYAYEYTPGPFLKFFEEGETYPDEAKYRVYKLNKSDGPEHEDWQEWPVEDGAPWIDEDGDGLYDPGVDAPDILGDQTLWCIYNDGVKADHANMGSDPLGLEVRQTAFGFNSPGALGSIAFLKFEIVNQGGHFIDSCFVSVWADPDLGADAADDLVGCDVDLSLGYCYNADNDDAQYGSTPPAMGYDFFQGPLVNADGIDNDGDGEIDEEEERLGMTSFNKYINGTDPGTPLETYNYMRGLDKEGAPVEDPVTGEITKFVCSGNPITGEGWVDTNPADRRYMCNSGPFTFAPGDTQEVVVAVLCARGTDRLNSISLLKIYDDVAQQTFDIDFQLPSPPDPPVVETHTFQDQKILLTWENNSENYPLPKHNVPADSAGKPLYDFEGYVVYQGETQNGPWHRIATYDVAGNDKTMLWAIVVDPETGKNIWRPVAYGEDTGIQYEMEITKDHIKGGSLKNGTPYYFAVTAYSRFVDYDGVDQATVPSYADPSRMVLETSISPNQAIPYSAKAGDDYSGVEGWEEGTDIQVEYHQETDTLKATTDDVTVKIIDPTLTTGHQYEVFWSEAEQDSFGNYPQTPTPDSKTYRYVWNLLDMNTGDLVLEKQWNKMGGGRYKIVDGMQVIVEGAYSTQLVERPEEEWWIDSPDTANGLGVQGYFQGEPHDFFGGGIDYGIDFHGDPGDPPMMNYGSTLNPEEEPEKFITVHIVWKNTIDPDDPDSNGTYVNGEPQGQWAYRYGIPNLPNLHGYFRTPVEVWEIDANGNRVRQLNMCFTEKMGSPSMDEIWCPTLDPGGGKEYFFIMNTTYDPQDTSGMYYGMTGDPDKPYGLNADVLYAGWIKHRRDPKDASYTTIEPGDILELKWVNPGDENDYYRFQTEAMISGDPDLIESDLQGIRVVPNPYYCTSAYELNQFNRVLKFINLPHSCEVRIFNLAGQMVRKLDKSNASPELTWDLRTYNNLPIASGPYIYHVTAFKPNTTEKVGTTYGKMIIFVEEERLNTF